MVGDVNLLSEVCRMWESPVLYTPINTDRKKYFSLNVATNECSWSFFMHKKEGGIC